MLGIVFIAKNHGTDPQHTWKNRYHLQEFSVTKPKKILVIPQTQVLNIEKDRLKHLLLLSVSFLFPP